MNPQLVPLQQNLLNTLEELVRLYRALLETVRREKDILIASNLDDLNDNNRAKEAILIKIQKVDEARGREATELAAELGLTGAPRLLDISRHVAGEAGDRLRNFHSVLELLLKRVQELNKENETLVQSALQHVTGAMKAIRDGLQEKPTYQRKGEVSNAPAPTGQLVSREA
jgi:flagellar biosynthesis/type III secretory pathway chaperone